MTGNTLYKRIEQGYKENYCDGTYTFELVRAYNYEDCDYLLRYTYKTGEMIEITVILTKYGEVLFYSPVHNCIYSNFNNHVKSVINVCRMLFDLIESNKDAMIEYYGVESTIETETETEESTNGEPVGYGGFTKTELTPDYDYKTEGWYSVNAMQYEHNVRIYKAIRGGTFNDRLPHVRSVKEIRERLEKTRPYSLCIYDDIKTRLRRIYNANYYGTVALLLEQLQKEVERCASNYADMLARKVNDALREWVK